MLQKIVLSYWILMEEIVLTIILGAALLMGKSSGFPEIVSSYTADAQDELECTTPNYLEYGQPGVIECSFQTPLFGVYWFNSTEYNNASHMIIYHSNSQTQGVGFLSREFDLSPTGSLIIKNVTFQHDHIFTVVKFNTISDDTIPIFVNVVVVVKPLQKFPKIDTCGDNRFCLRDAGEMKMLSCYVNNSWPAINLNFWTYNRHHQNWTEVFSSKSTAGENWQTSIIRIGLGMPTDILTVYVCGADEPPVLMNESESIVVIKRPIRPSQVEPTHLLVERGSNVEIPCSTKQNLSVLWMKQSDNITIDIGHRVIGRGYTDTEADEGYLLTNDSNLVIPNVSIRDEGIYVCVAEGGGHSESIKTFNITTTVQPNPQWVVVDGCFTRHNCSLPVRRSGFLRCGLRGVRPVVSLKWRFVDNSSLLNKFQKENLVVVKNSDSTYDVTLTSEYHSKEASIVTVTVECFAFQKDDTLGHWSHLSTQVTLELTTETSIDCCEKATSEHKTTYLISAAVAALVSIVVSCFSFGLSSLVYTRVRRIKPSKKVNIIRVTANGMTNG